LINSFPPLKQLKIDRMRYLLIALLFFSHILQAQTPKKPTYRNDTTSASDIRERLVQLAMQGPTYEMADHAAIAAGDQIKIAKSAYLGLFSFQANINQYTITGAPKINGQNVPYYYPLYNFSLNVPFDIFTRTTNTVKTAKQNYYILTAAKNQRFREIKADVLTKYENYLLAKQLVELQGKITQSGYATLKRSEGDFAENLIKLEEVESAQKSYINEQVRSLSLQRDYNVTKIELEKVIGVKIEEVERAYK
jgi:outer membrane protein TolC